MPLPRRQGGRFPLGQRRSGRPTTEGMRALRTPIHHLRGDYPRRVEGHQTARRSPGGLRPRQTPRGIGEGVLETSGQRGHDKPPDRGSGARNRGRFRRGGHERGDRTARDDRVAGGGRGGLRPFRLRLQTVQGYRPVHRRDTGAWRRDRVHTAAATNGQ